VDSSLSYQNIKIRPVTIEVKHVERQAGGQLTLRYFPCSKNKMASEQCRTSGSYILFIGVKM